MSALANQPAFPGIIGTTGYGNSTPQDGGNGERYWIEHGQGITLRQHFAAIAMQGILSNESQYKDTVFALNKEFGRTEKAAQGQYACTAMMAVEYADALIRALEETK